MCHSHYLIWTKEPKFSKYELFKVVWNESVSLSMHIPKQFTGLFWFIIQGQTWMNWHLDTYFTKALRHSSCNSEGLSSTLVCNKRVVLRLLEHLKLGRMKQIDSWVFLTQRGHWNVSVHDNIGKKISHRFIKGFIFCMLNTWVIC